MERWNNLLETLERESFVFKYYANSDNAACKASLLRLSLHVGVVRSRWVSWSSKPVAGRVAGRGGFDSHPLPPTSLTIDRGLWTGTRLKAMVYGPSSVV